MQFDHIPTAEELIAAYDETQRHNPVSPTYERKLERPKLHMFRVLLYIAITLALCIGIGFLASSLDLPVWSVWTLCAVFVLVMVLVHAKGIFIWLVRLYQRVAPEKVRRRCRFEPSCSEYMIASIEKYGFFKGASRGFSRLRRCKPPNGGIDMP